MEREQIEARIREISQSAADAKGLEFVHSEVAGTMRNAVVRVFVDKPGGVSVEDCASVSRRIEEVLDADDFIPTAYLLEVSSPGLERELYSIDDFRKFIGQKAKVKVAMPVNGQKVFVARIEGVEGGDILLSDKLKGDIRFPYSEVVKANLRVDLEQEFKKR